MRARLLIAALSLALMAFGFRHDPDSIERALESEDFGRRAAAIESILRQRGGDLQNRIIPLIRDADERIRGMAIAAAAELKLEEAVPALFEILRSDNEAQRIAAVEALARIDSSASRDALARALLDPERALRVAVLVNARIEGELIAPAAAALDDGDATVRALAAEALRESGVSAAFLSLSGKLNDPSPDVRVAVARALGALTFAESVPQLRGALGDSELRVREAAALALSRFGKLPRDQPAHEEAKQALVDFIERDASVARGAGILALSGFGDGAPIERILQLIHDESLSAPLIRAIARMSESVSGRERVAHALLDELERASRPGALRQIVDALLATMSAGPAEALTPRLIDALELAPQHRATLLRAIGASGGEASLMLLLLELEQLRAEASGGTGMSSSAASVLEALLAVGERRGQDHRVIEPVIALLPYLEPKETASALALLAPLAPPPLLARLIDNLKRPSHPLIRRASATALAQYDDEGALELLLTLLDDHDPEIRASAAAALGANAPSIWLAQLMERFARSEPTDRGQTLAIISALIARGALDESSPPERAAILASLYRITQGRMRALASEALNAISQSGDAEATEYLFASLARRDDALNAQALRALRSRPGERTRAALIEIITAERAPMVQAAALFALGRVAETRQLPAIEGTLAAGPLRAREAASFALLEISERGLIDAERARAYCDAIEAPSNLIRVNLFLLTERLGVRCPALDAPEHILTRARDELLKFAAASLLLERDDAAAERALHRCVERELNPAVARRCAQSLESGGAHNIRIRAAREGAGGSLPERVLLIQFSDGRLLPGLSDPRSGLSLHGILAGTVRLFDPVLLPLTP